MSPEARKYLENNRMDVGGFVSTIPIQPAITLRCAIAAQAMQGMIAATEAGADWPDPQLVATRAVIYADWLLEELAK